MDTKFFNENQIKEAAACIKAGQLVAFPTETVYGLGADATNQEAVEQVYIAKGRPSDNPLIVHVASKLAVMAFVDNVSDQATQLMNQFWPGPLTLIFKVKKGSLPSVVTGGLSTGAFRMPDNTLTLRLIEEAGRPLVGPSANTSGKPSPTSPAHVYHDLQGKIAGIIEDGQTAVGIESTVVDMTTEPPVILRPGVITQSQLAAVIGTVELDNHLISQQEAPKAPGMKYQHYAPNARVLMIDWQTNNWQEAIQWAKQKQLKTAILANQEIIQLYGTSVSASFPLSEKRSVVEASQHLFEGLRYLDEQTQPIELIFVESYPEEEAGYAYMNRLKKAANQKFF